MKSDRTRFVQMVGCVLLAFLIATPARAEVAADKETKFLRFVEDEEGGGRLETSIATYKNEAGATVDLVSAVHVGERKYYDTLDKRFAGYDALLYEMVKPKGAEAPLPGFQSESMVSVFQRLLKDVLELEFQLDAIDYRAKNFVHADLDAETFSRLQEERGESFMTLMLRSMLDEMSNPQQLPEVTMVELAVALTSPDRARHFKMILGRQFEDMERKVAGIEGPKGSVIIGERNKAAVAVVKEQLAKGSRKIGVFYGAAHMPDLDTRLKEMGFTRTDTEWVVAWDMTPQEGDVVVKTVKKKPAEPVTPRPQN